jgi:hypothetical protein
MRLSSNAAIAKGRLSRSCARALVGRAHRSPRSPAARHQSPPPVGRRRRRWRDLAPCRRRVAGPPTRRSGLGACASARADRHLTDLARRRGGLAAQSRVENSARGEQPEFPTCSGREPMFRERRLCRLAAGRAFPDTPAAQEHPHGHIHLPGARWTEQHHWSSRGAEWSRTPFVAHRSARDRSRDGSEFVGGLAR